MESALEHERRRVRALKKLKEQVGAGLKELQCPAGSEAGPFGPDAGASHAQAAQAEAERAGLAEQLARRGGAEGEGAAEEAPPLPPVLTGHVSSLLSY